MSARGQRRTAIKDSDVIQTQKTALKNVQAFCVLAVDPPRKVEHQLVEHPLQKYAVTLIMLFLVDLINAPRRPRQHRWVHIAKRPFIRRHLPIRMLVPFAPKQQQLLLGKFRIDQRQRQAMKRQIPCGEPGIFPLIGHRDNV